MLHAHPSATPTRIKHYMRCSTNCKPITETVDLVCSAHSLFAILVRTLGVDQNLLPTCILGEMLITQHSGRSTMSHQAAD